MNLDFVMYTMQKYYALFGPSKLNVLDNTFDRRLVEELG